MTKEGYQPIKNTIKKTTKIIPPNTGSHVQMKKEGYTWEDLDKAFWEGFDSAKSKMQKRIAELERENAELEAQIEKMRNCANCKYYQYINDAGYFTCTKDGKRNGKYYRSCEFNLEKWEIKEK